ncbi:MAG: 4-diphosphocytidyl-2-C-methyl-D-erythritol kinase [uncultured bacterium]|nr:MAG: 4-diphosphocytidyl-2-C-methyl-D-erythritol kinase [uncultured bacterium]
MKIFSPAKVNLFLKITQKRSDGYHELETIMQKIDFGDFIEISFNSSSKITIECNNPEVPPDSSNIIWKVIEIFYKESKIKFTGIHVNLNKKIPVGAGLGGGSSNAITFLKALNNHYNNLLIDSKLLEIASAIGSDTAFFLKDGTWLCTGRGEKLIRNVKSKKWTFLLIFPDFKCLTKKVYSNFIFDLTKSAPEPSLLTTNLDKASSEELEQYLYNNLRDAAFKSYNQMKDLVERIEKKTTKKVLISGSGSTMFMIFDDDCQAIQEKSFLETEFKENIQFFIAHTLN